MPKKKLFNGEPMSYWEDLAKQIVVDALLRAAMLHEKQDGLSLVSPLVYKRLMEIAIAEDRVLVERALLERKRAHAGFANAMQAFLVTKGKARKTFASTTGGSKSKKSKRIE